MTREKLGTAPAPPGATANTWSGSASHPNRHAEIDGMYLEHLLQSYARQGAVHEPRLTVEPQHDKSPGKGHDNA